MLAVILAGGRGTRLSEETIIKPKPLVEVNARPLLWHIMTHYSKFGVKDFIILTGYKGEMIRDYFKNIHLDNANIKVETLTGKVEILKTWVPDWNVSIIDTGLETQTAGRLAFLKPLIKEDFYLTYGDGICSVNLQDLYQQHKNGSHLVTLTAVHPPARFGALTLEKNLVSAFEEKPEDEGGWVNGGFMVVKPEMLESITAPNQSLEADILPKLAEQGLVACFKHYGFWQPVDTIRDLEKLNLYASSNEGDWINS